jgi:hypothetical protein
LKRDLIASAKILDTLRDGFEAGDYRAAPIAATFSLATPQRPISASVKERPAGWSFIRGNNGSWHCPWSARKALR